MGRILKATIQQCKEQFGQFFPIFVSCDTRYIKEKGVTKNS